MLGFLLPIFILKEFSTIIGFIGNRLVVEMTYPSLHPCLLAQLLHVTGRW